ncbi:hypothetical protein, partial [Nocardia cyriacigeorgica]|uniref:hypothetical protein n=1 Tax=Nocardia cyriacigeorgica TaxID=135487 RepID=UPI003CC7C425
MVIGAARASDGGLGSETHDGARGGPHRRAAGGGMVGGGGGGRGPRLRFSDTAVVCVSGADA